MQRILLKRTFRELKSNLLRYLALFLLITLCMFLVTGIVGAAQSVITTVNRHAEQNHLEDGQFGVWLPLPEQAAAEIESRGVTLEACFSLDFQMEDGSTLRLMKNREKINLIDMCEGEPASSPDQIVLERIYAAAHGIGLGDTVTVAGKEFTVSGTATSPDYDCCLQNVSDMSADGSVFGTAFVTADAYEALAESGLSLHSEEYRYSYLLGDGMSDTELKDLLASVKISPDDVQDVFFQEMIDRELADRNQAADGVQKAADGSEELLEALEQMEEGTETLQEGLQTAYSALGTLDGESPELKNASAQVLDALEALENSAGQLTFSLDAGYQLRDASSSLLAAAARLEEGLSALAAQADVSSLEEAADGALEQYGLDPENMSPDAQILYSVMQAYVSEISGYLSQSAEGAAALQSGLAEFDEAVSSLPGLMEALYDGITQFQEAISTLRSTYAGFHSGVAAYTDGLQELYDGFDQIMEGAGSLNSGAGELAEKGGEFRDGILELQSRTNEMLDKYFPYEMDNLTDFLTAADNPRIKAANDDVAVNQSIGMFAGVVVSILITYVISVFVVHSIDRESSVIGALYALGVKRRQLMLHYTMLPVLLCLAGGAAGTALGCSRFGLSLFAGESAAYYSIPEPKAAWNLLLLLYGILVPPVTACLVNTVIIRKRLGRTALSLLRKEQKNQSGKELHFKRLGYIRTFQIRQFLREKRSSFAVLAGMFVSMLVLMLGLTCYALCGNIQTNTAADVRYEYLYLYKYPEETVPENGCEAYIEELKKETMGYDMEVTIIGLTEENPFFPAIHSSRKNEISISTSVAQKYNLSVGDSFVLEDEVNESVYGFKVVEIVPYSVGLCVFMDIDSMRELWGQKEDYFNAVYSAQELDVDPGRLYSVSTRADAVKSAGIFMENMTQTMITLIAAAAVIFLVVLYQMMKVMIERSAQNISLMKIFGYRNREIRRLYLDGNFILIAAGAVLILPVCKLLTDAVYPYLVANVAGGLDLSWQPWMYFAVYAGILASYLVIRSALMCQIRKTSPAELLKDRE